MPDHRRLSRHRLRVGACGAKTILATGDKNGLASAIDRLTKAGVDAAAVTLGVAEPTAVTKAADAIAKEHGKVDIRVNSTDGGATRQYAIRTVY
jgi:NAD(P)-dependent dehydrogenase (short-subunit alcohol dehydrogenase family)